MRESNEMSYNTNETAGKEKVKKQEIIEMVLDLIYESVPAKDLSNLDPCRVGGMM